MPRTNTTVFATTAGPSPGLGLTRKAGSCSRPGGSAAAGAEGLATTSTGRGSRGDVDSPRPRIRPERRVRASTRDAPSRVASTASAHGTPLPSRWRRVSPLRCAPASSSPSCGAAARERLESRQRCATHSCAEMWRPRKRDINSSFPAPILYWARDPFRTFPVDFPGVLNQSSTSAISAVKYHRKPQERIRESTIRSRFGDNPDKTGKIEDAPRRNPRHMGHEYRVFYRQASDEELKARNPPCVIVMATLFPPRAG